MTDIDKQIESLGYEIRVSCSLRSNRLVVSYKKLQIITLEISASKSKAMPEI